MNNEAQTITIHYDGWSDAFSAKVELIFIEGPPTRTVESVREIYPKKKITAVFQPHLFSRTKDLAKEFAMQLSKADEVILLDIYPARELPVEGVTSDLIFKQLTCSEKALLKKEELLDFIANKKFEVLLTIGAGDIDKFLAPIKNVLGGH